MSPALADVLTFRAVQELADPRTLTRGTAYYHDGAVGLLDADAYKVSASVEGTQRYRVHLAAAPDGELEYECDCPVGADGIFCKHAVAVALSWLENAEEEVFQPSEQETRNPTKKRKTRDVLIREYLETLSDSALRDWVIEAADRDRGVRDKLLFAAKARQGPALPRSGPSSAKLPGFPALSIGERRAVTPIVLPISRRRSMSEMPMEILNSWRSSNKRSRRPRRLSARSMTPTARSCQPSCGCARSMSEHATA